MVSWETLADGKMGVGMRVILLPSPVLLLVPQGR